MTARARRRDSDVFAALEILEGPCCEDRACPAREAWPYPDETHEQFLARVGQLARADRRREPYR